jgi:hypothetical protein
VRGDFRFTRDDFRYTIYDFRYSEQCSVINVQGILVKCSSKSEATSYVFLYDLYGSNLFNHKELKVLREEQDNSTKVHKVNILNAT